MSTRNISWWVKADFTCGLSWNLRVSTSWNPQGLSRPVHGLLYLYLYVYSYIQCRISVFLNRRPLTVEALVRSRVSPCEVSGGNSGTETCFSPVLWFSSVSIIQPVLHILHFKNFHIINTKWRSLETFKEVVCFEAPDRNMLPCFIFQYVKFILP